MPNIYAIADRHRRALLADDAQAARAMTDAYAAAWRRIRMETDRLLRAANEARARGEEVGPTWLAAYGRLQSLQRQVEEQVRAFAQTAGQRIILEQGRAVLRAGQDAGELLEAAAAPARPEGELPPPGPPLQRGGRGPEPSGAPPGAEGRVGISFAQLPTEAVTQLVGTMQEGSPLRRLLDQLPGQTGRLVAEAIQAGLAAGLGAQTVARQVRQAAAVAYHRALTITRTEVLRSYREGTRLRYQANSDLVAGWIWHAGLSSRVCAACVAMHGTFHTLDERLDDHPRGRCIMVPVLRDVERVPVQGGEDWLRAQNESVQRSVLGTQSGWEAWRAGEVTLAAFVGRSHSEQWGPMRYRLPDRTVFGAERAGELRRAAARRWAMKKRKPAGVPV